MSIRLVTSFPPTVNSYYLSVNRSASRRISKKGREFAVAVLSDIEEQLPGVHYESMERLYLEVTLFPPDKRVRDLDNYMKALLDSLTKAGLWEDDSQIDQLFIMRGATVRGGSTLVEIHPAGPVVPHSL